MCQLDDNNMLANLVREATLGTGVTVVSVEPPPQSSRRRRLWELDGHAHCPVVGVCLPIATLRRIVDKTVGGRAIADDYELHCGAVADCKLRTRIAEALQRELDRRYMVPLRQVAKLKTTEALADWWGDALKRHDIAGALWATLSHPRCAPVFEHRVLGEIHMLQHQAGMAARVDLHRFDALVDENAVLARDLRMAQQRSTRQVDEQARRLQAQEDEILALRAQCIAAEQTEAQLRDDLQSLAARVPDLKSRTELADDMRAQAERLQALQQALEQAQQEAARQARRADSLAAELQQRGAQDAAAATSAPAMDASAIRLGDRAVLCVGGRPAAVPVYRHLVERTGARFLHHDGGAEDSSAKLDATMAAADLVICQTGCVSHDAYWRVKDHCRRTGKQCVFVETPSAAGLKRALAALAPPRTVEGGMVAAGVGV
jgi:hypothetical protein